jgi:hypothetical protein
LCHGRPPDGDPLSASAADRNARKRSSVTTWIGTDAEGQRFGAPFALVAHGGWPLLARERPPFFRRRDVMRRFKFALAGVALAVLCTGGARCAGERLAPPANGPCPGASGSAVTKYTWCS